MSAPDGKPTRWVAGLAALAAGALLRRLLPSEPTARPTVARRRTRPIHEHERSDASPAGVMFAAALVVVAVVVVVVVASWLLARFSGRPAVFHPASGGIADVAAVPATPEPRLEARPGTTLSSLRQSEDRRLGSYGWIDRAAGVVRIPIERAMELTAQRGLSVRPGAPAVMEPTAVGSASGRFLEPRAR